MAFITQNKRIIVWLLVGVMVLCSVLFMGAKSSAAAKTSIIRNATDSLMPLIELKTESGDDFDDSKKCHVEMLDNYVKHMESRHIPFLLRLPPFSKKNVAKELKRVAEDLGKADKQNAREAIEAAANSIAEFLTNAKPFTEEPIVAFEPDVMSEKIRDALTTSLIKAHEIVGKCAENPTVDGAEAACMANRKAMVYLYLARFGYQDFVNQEELKKFRRDINRTIYYNRLLQQTDAVQSGKGVEGSDYWRLDRYSDSEIRRLGLLQAIIDNDIQQAQVLLQIAVIKAIPDIQFLAVTR